jgi:hypothetical protein
VTELAPTAIALAVYFCIADIVLIAQCIYYNTLNARRAARHHHRRSSAAATSSDEDEPLLARQRSGSSVGGLPGSHRRPSMRRGGSRRRRSSSALDPITRIITGEDETPDPSPWLHNALSLLAVYAVGTAGWFVSYKMGAWDRDGAAPDVPDPEEGTHGQSKVVAGIGLALGYASAVCYLW